MLLLYKILLTVFILIMNFFLFLSGINQNLLLRLCLLGTLIITFFTVLFLFKPYFGKDAGILKDTGFVIILSILAGGIDLLFSAFNIIRRSSFQDFDIKKMDYSSIFLLLIILLTIYQAVVIFRYNSEA
jgi:hypothetical protein